MGSLGEVSVTADDRLEVGRVPTEDGGIISDTLGEGKDNIEVKGTGSSGGSATVARVQCDDCGTGGILERNCSCYRVE